MRRMSLVGTLLVLATHALTQNVASLPLFTINGTRASMMIATNQTVDFTAAASSLQPSVSSVDVSGSFSSVIDTQSSQELYLTLDALASGLVGNRSLTVTSVAWAVNCNQLSVLQAASCSMNQWLQYDQGIGYMFISSYQNGFSSFSSVNVTCPIALAPIPPCTCASIYSSTQLATALVQLQLGPPLTIKIMRNISIPVNGTQSWLAAANAAAPRSNATLVSSSGILIFCSLTLIGQPGSITEIDLGLNLDLLFINDSNELGERHHHPSNHYL